MIRRALVSVWDKTGLIDLSMSLAEAGVEIVSTGGTARALEQAGIPVKKVEELTGFPEILDGRVKTLHPAIHAGILARREAGHLAELQELSLSPLDLVVVNLYPFTETVARPDCTLEEALEQIDIGGVTLLRAAAKNFASVIVVSDPADYPRVMSVVKTGRDLALEERREFAIKAFSHTAAYDAAIHAYLTGLAEAPREVQFPHILTISLQKVSDLRYGENPHQKAAFYRLPGGKGFPDAKLLHGKALSFNNLLDLDAAWNAAWSFSQPTAVIVKHSNPCGLASAPTLSEAYRHAHACDPLSAFGGVIAFNGSLDEVTARMISETFVEAVIAPHFSAGALGILREKKDIRLLQIAEEVSVTRPGAAAELDMRRVKGGFLLQETDRFEAESEWKAVTQRKPTEEEMTSLRFAWRVVAHVKSNAIVLAKRTATVGIGAGQMSRVDSTDIAIRKAGPARSRGAVMASDAFFPFADSIELAADAGITAVIQPGGSIRDQEVIAAAERHNLSMIFTGSRHFRH